jgi:hypothetical protein
MCVQDRQRRKDFIENEFFTKLRMLSTAGYDLFALGIFLSSSREEVYGTRNKCLHLDPCLV